MAFTRIRAGRLHVAVPIIDFISLHKVNLVAGGILCPRMKKKKGSRHKNNLDYLCCTYLTHLIRDVVVGIM